MSRPDDFSDTDLSAWLDGSAPASSPARSAARPDLRRVI
jgi:hypothetical protein